VSREISAFGIETSRFNVYYGLAIGVAALVALYFFEGYLANVAFLVIGALLGIYPAFIIEERRRREEKQQLEKALFHELANRVGRCCFDFEDPWSNYLTRPESMDVFRLRKFVPEPPVIFPSVGARIALLEDEAAQALIDFYVALAAWKRDLENTAEQALAQPIPTTVNPSYVKFLARRLRQTLEPGQRALEALSKQVPGSEEIERNATRDGDRYFHWKHPNKGKLYRQRIEAARDATLDPPEP
jgi:hypothetical protein